MSFRAVFALKNDDRAALKAYLDNVPIKEAHRIAESRGIPPGSFWKKIGNFQYLATNGVKGLESYSQQAKRVWEEYKRTGRCVDAQSLI